MPVVTGKLTRPDLVEQGQISCSIELVDSSGGSQRGFVATTNETVYGPGTVALTAGVYTVTLPGNANISPANTKYKRTWFLPNNVTEVDYYTVPTGGGPYQEAALIPTTPLATVTPSTQEITPNLRSNPAPVWTESVFSTDAGGLDSVGLTFEHGQAVMRGTSGSASRSNRRSVFLVAGTPGGYSRIRSRWAGQAYAPASNKLPQRGHVHGLGIQADGKRRGVIVWHDITFNQGQIFNLGIWEANADGTGFVSNAFSPPDAAAVSAAARTTNVVTLTVPTGHGFVANDLVSVDLADNSYDGTFQITSVTATTIVYGQTAANAGTTTGTVVLTRHNLTKSGLIRTIAATDAVRASGVVTATVPANHSLQAGDWVDVDAVDNTYDGQFVLSDTTTSATQVKWNQAVADDASAGATTIVKLFPYWVESEWRPGQVRARVWPDVGVTGAGGVMTAGPPPWESPWAMSVTLTGTQPDPLLGQGCALVAAHLSANTVTEVRYDSIVCQGISA